MLPNAYRMRVFVIDLNECHKQRDICEPNSLHCNNTAGSYLCTCKTGFENKDASNKCTGQQYYRMRNTHNIILHLVLLFFECNHTVMRLKSVCPYVHRFSSTRSSANAKTTARLLQKLKGNPKFWASQGHAHFFFVCGFMVGLGKPKLYTKFEVHSFSHCENNKVEPQNFGELP